ncbi:MAG: VWA domain-containing protein [Acidobacteria bacterium]|nr:VWA domain-containing protein [Acidobacteriota bacterium]
MQRPTYAWPGLSLAALLLLLPLAVTAQTPPRPGGDKGRIRVEVNLVSVIASVLDKNNRPAPDLPKEAFELYEEGVRQKIAVFESETQQPLDLALMIDSSLSTTKELATESEAAAHFIRQVVRPGDRLAVFEFADTVTQLTEFSADVPLLQSAVRRIEPGAGTGLYDAVYLGAQALGKRAPGRRRVLVLVTDAGETTSHADFDTARRAALRTEALMYSIVIRPVRSEGGRNTAGEHALETITETTGGAVYYPDSMAELDEIFDRIDRELRTQYRLGYYPEPRPPEKSFRRIEVRMKGADGNRGYTVRFRKGYFTAAAIE